MSKLNFKDKVYLMGILNITVDSFFDGNKYFEKNKAIEHGLKIIEDGADIIDIGGQSTKPNSLKISSAEEITRVVDIIREIRKLKKDVLISIDTYKSDVAKEALEAGADIVNDVYGGLYDKKMFDVCKKYNSYICLTHNRLYNSNKFLNVVEETYNELKEIYNNAVKSGIKEEKIIIDPGLGFSKYGKNNILILRNIEKFKELNAPILVGASRKKFLSKICKSDPLMDNFSTLSVSAYLSSKGVNILRVHDVKENKKIIDIINSIMFGGDGIE